MRAGSRGSGGERPSPRANGAIAHSRKARGSRSSHCSRAPTHSNCGNRGACNLARPTRAAHQEAATAMAKAKTAVYSASSLEGYSRRLYVRPAGRVSTLEANESDGNSTESIIDASVDPQ